MNTLATALLRLGLPSPLVVQVDDASLAVERLLEPCLSTGATLRIICDGPELSFAREVHAWLLLEGRADPTRLLLLELRPRELQSQARALAMRCRRG